MICDKCKKKVDKESENWQRFECNGVEITLCETDVKGLFAWIYARV